MLSAATETARAGIRRLPVGAEVQPGGVHFRVWAPASSKVAVVFEEKDRGVEERPAHSAPLTAEENGYCSGFVPSVGADSLYRYELDSGRFPDPASRFQPAGPHGASQIVDPARFKWGDQDWRGCGREGQVLYEIHIGTFTPEGTWRAAAQNLESLRDLGITILEIMPVADFCGRFGWGYDGVNLFAPTRLYGSPDDFRAFVDRAHQCGVGVILDVVYNHFGPDGCFLREFSPNYFTKRYENEWGEAINFDGPESAPVRELFEANAGYWVDEYHLDGLRLDATQQVFDSSPDHILAAITRRVREAGGQRQTYIVNENEPQDVRLVRPESEGGYGMDSLWNDDFHHSATVALTGRNEAYYSDYTGRPQEFVSMIKYGYLYQGQWYRWQKNRRGTPSLHVHPSHFVDFIQNHDQVANSLRGRRIHQLASPGSLRAITALFLLGPHTPMLFQGQEFAASAPFFYFADHSPELAKMVATGRRTFLEQFPSIAGFEDELHRLLVRPESEETFFRCKLDHGQRERHAAVYQLHRDLLELRRSDSVFRRPRVGGVDGAVLGRDAFVLRFFGADDDDRLLLVNLGVDLRLAPAPEPLLAPARGCGWRLLWTSEFPAYGGSGTPPVDAGENWVVPGQAAVVLSP